MTEKLRSPRRRFDSSSLIPKEEPQELPSELIPADAGETARPAVTAPIVILPIGTVDEDLVRAAIPMVTQTFGNSVSIAKALPVPKYAYNPSREQYHSAAILKRVEGMCASDWAAAIGVADVDLFVPEVPFIFGEADRSTRSAVISLVRLRPDMGSPDTRRELMIKRVSSEVTHQMGLIRGLAHCPNNRCVMFQSGTIQDTDKKGLQLCANCRKRLTASS